MLLKQIFCQVFYMANTFLTIKLACLVPRNYFAISTTVSSATLGKEILKNSKSKLFNLNPNLRQFLSWKEDEVSRSKHSLL